MRKKKVNSDGTSPQLQTFATGSGLNREEKRKVVQRGGLCNKCLAKGHIAKDCPKVNFKCQHSGCGGGHHTFMQRNPVRTERGTGNESNARDARQRNQNAGSRDMNPNSSYNQVKHLLDLVMKLGPVMALE